MVRFCSNWSGGRTLVTSRLLDNELWTALHRGKLKKSRGAAASELLTRFAWIELVPEALERALEPFPKPLRTLDALHLAAADFLRHYGQPVAARREKPSTGLRPAPGLPRRTRERGQFLAPVFKATEPSSSGESSS